MSADPPPSAPPSSHELESERETTMRAVLDALNGQAGKQMRRLALVHFARQMGKLAAPRQSQLRRLARRG